MASHHQRLQLNHHQTTTSMRRKLPYQSPLDVPRISVALKWKGHSRYLLGDNATRGHLLITQSQLRLHREVYSECVQAQIMFMGLLHFVKRGKPTFLQTYVPTASRQAIISAIIVMIYNNWETQHGCGKIHSSRKATRKRAASHPSERVEPRRKSSRETQNSRLWADGCHPPLVPDPENLPTLGFRCLTVEPAVFLLKSVENKTRSILFLGCDSISMQRIEQLQRRIKMGNHVSKNFLSKWKPMKTLHLNRTIMKALSQCSENVAPQCAALSVGIRKSPSAGLGAP